MIFGPLSATGLQVPGPDARPSSGPGFDLADKVRNPQKQADSPQVLSRASGRSGDTAPSAAAAPFAWGAVPVDAPLFSADSPVSAQPMPYAIVCRAVGHEKASLDRPDSLRRFPVAGHRIQQ